MRGRAFLLSADGLTVARGRRVLLDRFSLDLSSGEAVQIAGANGCGKSSLLRMLTGAVEPRRGSVQRAARCVYVPERAALPDSLPARRWCRRSRRPGIAHVASGAVGGALALLLGSLTRVATAFAAILAVIIGSIALAGVAGIAASPGAVSHALGDSAPDAVSARLVGAGAITLIEAAALAHGCGAMAGAVARLTATTARRRATARSTIWR